MSLRDEIEDFIKNSDLENMTFRTITDAILALPEMVEMRETAEKWDRWKDTEFGQLDLLMSDLVVRKKCKNTILHRTKTHDYYPAQEVCPDCHGTGTIERQAEPEEVREFLEVILTCTTSIYATNFLEDNHIGRLGFKLKSGAILFMGKEKK